MTAISGWLGDTPTSYDAAGNVATLFSETLSYNDAGHAASFPGVQWLYNALGERVSTSITGVGATIFVYDEARHLLGEYDGSGNLIQETVWMGDVPVATLRPSANGIAIYYVHSDHLNTPRKVSQPSTNALAWRWDPAPFGITASTAAPDENPAGLGDFEYDLEFPGQFYDGITVWNNSRDYLPQFGAYLESDPIGLAGGSYSTYAYVRENPI
jgi:RHS repeat-associated protein